MGKYKKVKRHSSIYGKNRKSKKLLIQILVAIVVFAVIVGGVYLIAFALSKNSQQQKPPETPLVNSGVSSQQSQQSQSSVASEVKKTHTPIKAKQMPVATAKNKTKAKTFIDTAKEEGYTAVVVPLKAEDGIVLYSSKVPEVKAWGASAATVDAKTLISQIEKAGMTPIAQINAFVDNKAPHASRDNSYTYASKPSTTYLFNKKRYLNPYQDDARKYICDIVEELGSIGFSKVLIDSVQFPNQEFTSEVETNAGSVTKAEILKKFIKELNSTKVSTIISYDSSIIDDEDEAKLLYGGDIATYGAQALSPIIDNSSSSSKSISKITQSIKKVNEEAKEAQIVPQFKLGQTAEDIEKALSLVKVDSYIETP